MKPKHKIDTLPKNQLIGLFQHEIVQNGIFIEVLADILEEKGIVTKAKLREKLNTACNTKYEQLTDQLYAEIAPNSNDGDNWVSCLHI